MLLTFLLASCDSSCLKAKAAEQQSDLILAKDAVDKLIPTNASISLLLTWRQPRKRLEPFL